MCRLCKYCVNTYQFDVEELENGNICGGVHTGVDAVRQQLPAQGSKDPEKDAGRAERNKAAEALELRMSAVEKTVDQIKESLNELISILRK